MSYEWSSSLTAINVYKCFVHLLEPTGSYRFIGCQYPGIWCDIRGSNQGWDLADPAGAVGRDGAKAQDGRDSQEGGRGKLWDASLGCIYGMLIRNAYKGCNQGITRHLWDHNKGFGAKDSRVAFGKAPKCGLADKPWTDHG